jgi:two-component system sensor histidine kinase KdpD
MSSLYALSQQLARSAGLDQVVQATAQQVAEILGVRVMVLLSEPRGLDVKATQPPGEKLTSNEWAAAMWVWQHNQPAGPGTDTLPGCERLFVPLTTAQGTLGVLGLSVATPGSTMTPDQRRLVQALADQAAVAIERARLGQAMAEAHSMAEMEKLRNALLSSISHDLRTPLTSIIGAVTSLQTADKGFSADTRRDLLLTIQEEAERLNRFVGNLLDMTRLESGALQMNRAWVEAEDVIGSALARAEKTLKGRRIDVQIEPDLPLLWLDFVLMEQVLINLLDNAAKYSAPETTIRVDARRSGGGVTLDIADEGVGVPPDDLERIFDKFYRVRRGDQQVAGTGLGLSICRGIVDAHGGRISARLQPNKKGTVFTIELPVQKGPGA